MSIRERLAFCPELRDTSTWAAGDLEGLAALDRAVFDRRKRAVEMFLGATSFAEIKKETGLSKSEVYRYVERCLTMLPGGCMAGFNGLLPHCVIKPYTRQAPINVGFAGRGLAGAFLQLMAEQPTLYSYVRSKVAKSQGKTVRVSP